MSKKRQAQTLIILSIIGLALVGLAVFKVPAIKNRVRGRLQSAGILPPPLPTYLAPIAPPDRVSARRLVVATLYDALARHDYEQVAALNATLSQEAFQRAYHTLQAWETVRDPDTGLVPHATSSFYNTWDSKDIATDLSPHLLIASHCLDPENEALWNQALLNERQIYGTLACYMRLSSGQIIKQDLDTRIFDASECAKAGLLAIAERFRPAPGSTAIGNLCSNPWTKLS